ncbi:Gfo/Idh/MocA family protein [Brachybacterium fresconis]|uniref:Dehydrogenase n=1 Tax=Brachybacterium fresconis TaxID=173363 RepID=A0ABS4YIU1_9MICO|nr:Gfo/Idh/MocA family oxidoreductase [Brachybacterium fresconis]MBP2408715.1 putative dehydrogenase [Brachybacterium fresconis]
MPKTLNIAVIGAGTMAQAVHLPVLRRRWDRFAVTALVDHSPRRRRESSEVWGLDEDVRYESVADLITAVRAKTVSVDAAVLSTDGLHAEDLLQLMRRGIPVLVEPPLGYSAEEIAKVADFERMTGRPLLMMAYPQQYDDSVQRMSEQIALKDLRMVDHEVLMPASQPLFGGAHVTTSSYDLPSEVRTQRRSELQAAVVAGSGDGATQRDRDLYVKGLLTGVAHQMAVLEATYGPITDLVAVRHWPKGVIPGSIELLGSLGGGAQVRLVWHYLPFAPEYSEHIEVLSARRRMRVELPAPSHGDRRSTVALREKKSGVVQETGTTATKGSAELMWDAFHAFVEKGTAPISGAEQARAQVTLLREVLATIVAADGRSIDKDPEEEAESEEEAAEAGSDGEAVGSDGEAVGSDGEATTSDDAATADDSTATAAVEATTPGAPTMTTVGSATTHGEAGEHAASERASPAPEPAAETLEQAEVAPTPDAEERTAPAGTQMTEQLPSAAEISALEETRGSDPEESGAAATEAGNPAAPPAQESRTASAGEGDRAASTAQEDRTTASAAEPGDVWNLETPTESTWPPTAGTTRPATPGDSTADDGTTSAERPEDPTR